MVNELHQAYQLNQMARSKPHICGYSLIELMIIVAVIGVIVSVAVPAYRGYIETTNMTKVNSAYQYAVRSAQAEFSKDTVRITLGLESTLPVDDKGWIDLFDGGGNYFAPGGGPIYIAGSPKGKQKKKSIDPNVTGSIRVKFKSEKQELEITRPGYLSLVGFKAKITREKFSVTKTR